MTKRRVALLGGFAAVVLAAVWLLAIFPAASRTGELERQAADVRTSIVKGQAAARSRAANQALATTPPSPATSRASERMLDRAIPTEAVTGSILRTVDRAATATGVTFQSIRFDPAAKPGAGAGGAAGGVTAMPLNMTVAGSYSRLAAFLRRLAGTVRITSQDRVVANGRLVAVDGLSVSVDGDNPARLSAELHGEAFSTAPAPTGSAQKP